MESIISTFHIDWKIIVAQAINFGIVFAVLYVFALKPLAKLMAERSEKIARGVSDAKENAGLLEKTRAEYDAAILKAKAEADKIFAAGKKEAEDKKKEMLESAQLEAAKTIASGRQALAAEKIKVVNEAKSEIISLAMLATEKIIKEKQDLSKLG